MKDAEEAAKIAEREVVYDLIVTLPEHYKLVLYAADKTHAQRRIVQEAYGRDRHLPVQRRGVQQVQEHHGEPAQGGEERALVQEVPLRNSTCRA